MGSIIGFNEGTADGISENGLIEGSFVGEPTVGDVVGFRIEGLWEGRGRVGERVGNIIVGVKLGKIPVGI